MGTPCSSVASGCGPSSSSSSSYRICRIAHLHTQRKQLDVATTGRASDATRGWLKRKRIEYTGTKIYIYIGCLPTSMFFHNKNNFLLNRYLRIPYQENYGSSTNGGFELRFIVWIMGFDFALLCGRFLFGLRPMRTFRLLYRSTQKPLNIIIYGSFQTYQKAKPFSAITAEIA